MHSDCHLFHKIRIGVCFQNRKILSSRDCVFADSLTNLSMESFKVTEIL